MKLLVLGGTVFLGRHLVADALARGHEVSLFTRGVHGADLFPEAEHLVGDRASDLASLDGRSWDVVVDTSGMIPGQVRASSELLSSRCGFYAFVSTVSVLDTTAPGVDEDGPRPGPETLPDPTTEVVTAESYGPLKAGCEDAVRAEWGERGVVVRPGLIVGPWDYSGRFAYWPVRFGRGGAVLVPAPSERVVQFIDVRDLARWIVDLVEARRGGVFNATGPAEPLAWSQLVEGCLALAPAGTEPVWVDEAFLLEREVAPWVGLPLWIPEAAGMEGFSRIDCRAARGAGLTFRPLRDTLADTSAWAREHPELALPSGGPALTAETERELVRAWQARDSSSAG